MKGGWERASSVTAWCIYKEPLTPWLSSRYAVLRPRNIVGSTSRAPIGQGGSAHGPHPTTQKTEAPTRHGHYSKRLCCRCFGCQKRQPRSSNFGSLEHHRQVPTQAEELLSVVTGYMVTDDMPDTAKDAVQTPKLQWGWAIRDDRFPPIPRATRRP